MHSLHLCLHGWQVQVFSLNDPRRELHDLRCRKNPFADKTFDDRVTDVEFFRCLLLCYPAILLLEWLDAVIPTQAGDPGSVPVLLLARFLSEAIQNCSNRFIRTDLG